MIRRATICVFAGALALALGCQSGPEDDGGAGQPTDGGSPSPAEPVGPAQEAAFDGFDEHAFPPTLPVDEAHVSAWTPENCLLCHEEGTQGAPVVQHTGMSPVLLSASCRTCHVPGAQVSSAGPATGPASGLASEASVSFSGNAFPPVLPHDTSHEGAWERTDCLLCHQDGASDAPRVQHEGMSRLLLKARCRTCHLPSVASGEADYPGR